MPAAIAKWRFMPGIRVTDPARVVSVDLEAVTDTKPSVLGGEGDVHYVKLEVKNSLGTVIQTKNQTGRSLRFPNYSAGPSPIPGASAGSMAGVWGFGVTLDPSLLPQGKISIGAKVYSQKGTETTMPEVWFWNDTSGNSRYSSKKVFVNASTGSDSNPGTEELPVRTIINALGKSVFNPAGSSFADRNAGGAEIVCTGQFVGMGAWTSHSWHTADQWLTVTATPGTSFTRSPSSGNSFPSPGAGNQGVLRLRWVGWSFIPLDSTSTPAGPDYYVGEFPSTAVQMHVWMDGFTIETPPHALGRRWSVASRTFNGDAVPFSGAAGYTGKSYYSCAVAKGRELSFEFTHLQDVVIEDYVGIAMQTNQRQPGAGGANIVVRHQRYVTNDIHGLVNVFGPGLVVTVPAAGQMRVEQTGTLLLRAANDLPLPAPHAGQTIDLAAVLEGMEDYPSVRYRFQGFAAGNNGNFPVLSSGFGLNGNAYAIFANPTAVPETAGAGAHIDTVTVGGSRWYDVVHPDIIQYNYATVDSFFSSIVAYDIDNSQGYFAPNPLTRCALINCTEGNGQRNNFAGVVMQDCVFLHNAWAGEWSLPSNSTNVVGCCIEENVFGSVTGSVNLSTNWWRNNHFVSGPTQQS